MSGVFQWSQTAATNATADPTVNFAEGQAPNTVNDSARALMASVAKWRDDLSGSLTTTGTASAYVLTSNQTFTSLSALGGQLIAFRAHLANNSSPTLNVDGLGAKALTTDGSTGLPSGTFVAGTVYVASYDSTNSVFRVVGLPGSGVGFPAGTLMLFQQNTAPTGWVKQASHDDKVPRIVSGTASFGGIVPFSTILTTTVTGSTVLAASQIPSHTHGYSGTTSGESNTHTHAIPGFVAQSAPSGGGAIVGQSAAINTDPNITDHTHNYSGTTDGGSGGGLGHTHPMDLRLQYVDLIIAAKS